MLATWLHQPLMDLNRIGDVSSAKFCDIVLVLISIVYTDCGKESIPVWFFADYSETDANFNAEFHALLECFIYVCLPNKEKCD